MPYSNDDFTLDWSQGEATCPAGKKSKSWGKFETEKMGKFIRVQFRKEDCQECSKRKLVHYSQKVRSPANTQAQRGVRCLAGNPAKR